MGVEELIPHVHPDPLDSIEPHKFAILLAGHATEYIRTSYGGVACLFKHMLSDPGETWDTYRVVDGEFPSDQDLCQYEAFIITGSKQDAHGSDSWVLQLCELIRNVYKLNKKLLGICFGHQVISRALGGKTGRASGGWAVGLKKVVLAKSMWSKPYAIKLPQSLTIVEFHQDEVYELPVGGEVLAWSEKTSTEIFGIGQQVLGIQGHPEFTEDITLDILDVCLEKRSIPEDLICQARLTFREGKADHEILKNLCKSFLKATFCQVYDPFSCCDLADQ